VRSASARNFAAEHTRYHCRPFLSGTKRVPNKWRSGHALNAAALLPSPAALFIDSFTKRDVFLATVAAVAFVLLWIAMPETRDAEP